jgi:hypothetical protein
MKDEYHMTNEIIQQDSELIFVHVEVSELCANKITTLLNDSSVVCHVVQLIFITDDSATFS